MKIEEILSVIRGGRRNRFLCHFTDESNIASIKENGILSKERIGEFGIDVSVFGGNETSWRLDDRYGLFNFVSLCFTREHPMCYEAQRTGRIKSAIYLEILPSILSLPGVKITTEISNKSGNIFYDVEDGFDVMHCDVLYDITDWSDPVVQKKLKSARRYEALIPNCVPPKFIRGL